MKLSKVFIIFLAIILSLTFSITAKLTFGANVLIHNSWKNSNMSNFVCKITKEIITTSSHTQDVLIANLGNQRRISVVNDICDCLKDDNPIVISDLQKPIKEKDLRKATVIVLEIEWISVVRVHESIMSNNHIHYKF
ncbi:hypothetical protein ACKWTF_001028 [Chironomus riparius]